MENDVAANQTRVPPSGKAWLILCGIITHITGTASNLRSYDTRSTYTLMQTKIGSTEANGTYPIFNTSANLLVAQFQLWILDETMTIKFTGGATSDVRIMVLEWST